MVIKSIDIKRFRGFKDAHVGDCRRMNLVVGENGSGKTSFLEALFIASSVSPESAIRLRNWRGLAEGSYQGTPAQIEDAIWRDLFHKFDKDLNISVSLKGDANHTRAVTISYNEQGSLVPLSDKSNTPLSSVSPILFKWRGPRELEHQARPVIEGGAIRIPAGPRLPTETFFFAANQVYSATETAVRFSEMSRVFRETEISELFREHFKNIEGLSIEVVAGVAMVYARVTGMAEKVPLNLLSSGMSKLASLLFAIPTQKGGLVLIDEIENGLHYKRLPFVWKSLLAFCKKYDTQIFASTHSAECLAAAAQLAEEHAEDFSVIYVGTQKSVSTLRQFGGDRFSDAINEDIEIR
jgi:predicted ATPase